MEIVVFRSKSWKVPVFKQTSQDIIKFAVTNQRCTLFCRYRPSNGATHFLYFLQQLSIIHAKTFNAF